MESYCLCLAIILALTQAAMVDGTVHMKSRLLCSHLPACDTDKCPPSQAYPHMTAFDDSLTAGTLQSDYVSSKDRGVYSVPEIIQPKIFPILTGSLPRVHHLAIIGNGVDYCFCSPTPSTFYHRFRNYTDKCSNETYPTVDKQHGTVKLRALKKLINLADADWKPISPPRSGTIASSDYGFPIVQGNVFNSFWGKKRETYSRYC